MIATMEMVVNGVSTLCQDLDPMVQEWNRRVLGEFPFVLMDAIVTKIRKLGQVRSQSIMLSAGLNIEDYRRILGIKIGDSETYEGWHEHCPFHRKDGPLCFEISP